MTVSSEKWHERAQLLGQGACPHVRTLALLKESEISHNKDIDEVDNNCIL